MRKFIAPPQRQKKIRLRGESRSIQSGAISPRFKSGEIDVRRKVLSSGCCVEILGHAMVLIGQERAVHMMIIKKFGRVMTVVDSEDITVFHAAADLGDPVAGLQAGFSVLAFVESNALRRKIFGDGAGGERRREIHKVIIAEADKDFFQRAAIHSDSMDRQRVKQFVRKKTACEDARWNLNGNGETSHRSMPLRACRCLFAARGGALSGNIAQCSVKIRQFRFAETENLV